MQQNQNLTSDKAKVLTEVVSPDARIARIERLTKLAHDNIEIIGSIPEELCTLSSTTYSIAMYNLQMIKANQEAYLQYSEQKNDVCCNDSQSCQSKVQDIIMKDYDSGDESFTLTLLSPQKFYEYTCTMQPIEDAWKKDEMIEIQNSIEMKNPITGYVYAAVNPLFSHLIKISATSKTPMHRLKQLSNTNVPEPFQLLASIPSNKPFELEKQIHSHFNYARKYGKMKEFFRVDASMIKDVFRQLSEGLSLSEISTEDSSPILGENEPWMRREKQKISDE